MNEKMVRSAYKPIPINNSIRPAPEPRQSIPANIIHVTHLLLIDTTGTKAERIFKGAYSSWCCTA